MLFNYQFNKFKIVAVEQLKENNLFELISNLPAMENTINSKILSGRGAVNRADLSPFGRVVIKPYIRGGLLAKLPFFNFHLSQDSYRSEHEFNVLQKLNHLGINVPEPLAWVGKGRLLRTAWLVMREIQNESNLADLSLKEDCNIQELCTLAAREVIKLIESGIWHLDLHPGNVLFDQNKKIYLIDFDKACNFKGSLNKLRDLYICRWRRAVLKYNLPENLIEFFVAEVRKDYGMSKVA